MRKNSMLYIVVETDTERQIGDYGRDKWVSSVALMGAYSSQIEARKLARRVMAMCSNEHTQVIVERKEGGRMSIVEVRTFKDWLGELVDVAVNPCPKCKTRFSMLLQDRQYLLAYNGKNSTTSYSSCRAVCAECGYKTEWAQHESSEGLYWDPSLQADAARMKAIALWNNAKKDEEGGE